MAEGKPEKLTRNQFNQKLKQRSNEFKRAMEARHADCLSIYLELGPQRSLEKARQIIIEKYGPISHRTLQFWSAKEKWRERSKEYDVNKAAEVALRKGEILDIDSIPITDSLLLAAKRLVKRALDASEVYIPGSAGEIEAVVRTAERALKLREFMLDPKKQTSAAGNQNVQLTRNTFNVVIPVDKAIADLENRSRSAHATTVRMDSEVLDLEADEIGQAPKQIEHVTSEVSTPTVAELLAKRSSPGPV